ncbi:hypothetical protein KSB_48530 [Ktedonobacter robiniae]|uniref:Histidine-specific methyltransferase SAM-dependent domain-containing protein n=1 Tax=Ktedonobacter robiniae TaxID=2778365 RepID=A0ABQ3UUL0_9CHLR|nr:hypothetical protein KSB_48530 [Ktedonobacter robiniae]
MVVFVATPETNVLGPDLLSGAARQINDWYERQIAAGLIPDSSGRSSIYPLADRIVAENFGRLERRYPWDPNWYYGVNFVGEPSALDLGVLQRVHLGFQHVPGFQRKSKKTLAIGIGPSIYELLMTVAHTEDGCPIHVIDPSRTNREFHEKVLEVQPALVTYRDGQGRLVEIDLHHEARKWEAVLVAIGGGFYRGAFRKARLAYQAGTLQVLDGSVFRLSRGAYHWGFMFCCSESITREMWIFGLANQSFAEAAENWVASFVTGEGEATPLRRRGPSSRTRRRRCLTSSTRPAASWFCRAARNSDRGRRSPLPWGRASPADHQGSRYASTLAT